MRAARGLPLTAGAAVEGACEGFHSSWRSGLHRLASDRVRGGLQLSLLLPETSLSS